MCSWSIRCAVSASNLPRKWPSASKSGNTRPFASWPIGSGILVKLGSPEDALGVAVARALFLRPFDCPNIGGAEITTDSKTDNNQTSQLQCEERPLRNSSMDSL